jgi:hypothetical protein
MMKNQILIMLVFTTFAGNANAYLDPGTGSILLQGLLAGLLAVGVYWRNFRDYVKGLFSKKESSETEDGDTE